MSDRAKYRAYTRASLQGGVALIGVVAVIASAGHPWVTALVVLVTVSGVIGFQGRPELTGADAPRTDRVLPSVAGAGLIIAWAGILAIRGTDVADDETARGLAWFAVMVAGLALIAFLPRPWLILLIVAVGTGCLFGPSGDLVRQGLWLFVAAAFCMATTRLSLWTLRVVDDLDAARRTEAKLQVAEERLRFSRDLHDVVGRGFSTIAVKSELASRLARSSAEGTTERAAAEMDEVKVLAVSSMEEMRSLVRGYRGIDLAGEVAGARSLLDAAGCRLLVQGDPAAVPTPFHEAAAWVVREGTTNIVRHSAASEATLTLGPDAMSLTNDGAPPDPGERSGLRGLAERIEPLGGTLETHSEGGTFSLEIRWEAA
ncbi:sensor histidine kinase [Gordonia zhaorongruii]|uniref:sensor histidine kinase n=1 Tax=Gordonia zhaorongruii TaxID=2597659 RepID=UPI001F24BE81|nr:histidine kinase [Gordonia zhaorongruii]